MYEQDYHLWLIHNATLLRENKLHEIDVLNLAEELEAIAGREKRVVEDRLIVLLIELLKWQVQVMKRSSYWQTKINIQRRRLCRFLTESFSLRLYLNQIFNECYSDARDLAVADTGFATAIFPKQASFTLEAVLTADYQL